MDSPGCTVRTPCEEVAGAAPRREPHRAALHARYAIWRFVTSGRLGADDPINGRMLRSVASRPFRGARNCTNNHEGAAVAHATTAPRARRRALPPPRPT